MSPDPKLRTLVAAFLKRTPGVPEHVRAYLTNEGFLEHLEKNWRGPELVCAIVDGEKDVRGSLSKRPDAFSYAGRTDGFARQTRLVMYADASGARFFELDPS
jgi:hypothetical protein